MKVEKREVGREERRKEKKNQEEEVSGKTKDTKNVGPQWEGSLEIRTDLGKRRWGGEEI